MQLSPLNTIGMIQRIRKDENDQGLKDESGVEGIVMYRCKSCGETYEWKSEAEDCCPQLDTHNKPACPVCGEHYPTHRDAADCCLWKDLGAIERWRIADAVEAGSDWSTELNVKAR